MKYPYPVMYKNVYAYDEMKRGEHMAVRKTVGWYLWTHQLVEVTGKDAVALLEYIFPKNIGNLAVGRERYTTMLDENGTIIDDVVVFRMDEEKFWISTLFKVDLMAWLDAHKGELDAAWEDITKNWEMYAVQGPKSLEMVNALVKEPVDAQKFFEMKANEIDGIPVYINRAGYTGEKLGYEIYYPKAEAPAQEKKLRALAESLGVFISLIVVNCIILGRAESFSYKNGVAASFFDGIFQGIGYTLVLLAMCIIREFLGAGTFGGGLLGPDGKGIAILPEQFPAAMMTLPVGGFLTLGCLIALMQWALSKSKK